MADSTTVPPASPAPVELPPELRVAKYAEARVQEILGLEAVLSKSFFVLIFILHGFSVLCITSLKMFTLLLYSSMHLHKLLQKKCPCSFRSA